MLTTACVEGERFTAGVVARVHGLDERAVVQQLSGELERRHHLVSAQGVRRPRGVGSPVAISSLEFKLLRYFIEHRGALLSRQELLEKVPTCLKVVKASFDEELEDMPHHTIDYYPTLINPTYFGGPEMRESMNAFLETVTLGAWEARDFLLDPGWALPAILLMSSPPLSRSCRGGLSPGDHGG